jgi:hypothetical protein
MRSERSHGGSRRKLPVVSTKHLAFLALSFALIVTKITGCVSQRAEAPLLVSYQSGGGVDMYENGDRYGHRIEVRFNGEYKLHRLTYRESEEGDTLASALVRQDTLAPDVLDTLKAQVQRLQADSVSPTLPDVDPRSTIIRTPARSVRLEARPKPAATAVKVEANMGADRENYPPSFLTLYGRLQRLIESTRPDFSSD